MDVWLVKGANGYDGQKEDANVQRKMNCTHLEQGWAIKGEVEGEAGEAASLGAAQWALVERFITRASLRNWPECACLAGPCAAHDLPTSTQSSP